MSKSHPVTDSSSEHSKAERVYRELRRRIRGLELQPGSRLQKNEIALEFDVSRAPVSEAIAWLAEEGLVDVYPQSGSFVAPIRPEDVREALLIRTGLEVEAVRRVTQMADAELLQRLDKNLDAQAKAVRDNDMATLDDLDEAFHAIIFASIKSPRAQRLLDSSRALLDRPRFHALPEDGRPYATLNEHRRIADAIRTGDVELAGAAMRVHIAMVARAIERDTAETESQSRLKSVK
ncbi:MAG TPA: GntR family transcriptional regulator [Steroidobacteraceae bacterium]|nr:GntR family transcriptional regulator [Steroidobacteraceae bacterium]